MKAKTSRAPHKRSRAPSSRAYSSYTLHSCTLSENVRANNQTYRGNCRLVGHNPLRLFNLLLNHPRAHVQPSQHSRLLKRPWFNVRHPSRPPHRAPRFGSDFRRLHRRGRVSTEAGGVVWGVVDRLRWQVVPLGSSETFGRNKLLRTTIDDGDLFCRNLGGEGTR